MVNVDELNEDIKQFGTVIEKVSNLPNIYDSVQEQLDTSKKNFQELYEIQNNIKVLEKQSKDELEEISNNIDETLVKQHIENTNMISSLEKSAETKIDKAELELRDRIALTESNMTLALNDLKSIIEKNVEEDKKRFVILTVEIAIVIILQIVFFFIK